MRTVRVAVVQDAPAVFDRDATLDLVAALVGQAAGRGSQLVVFPEAFVSGAPWPSRRACPAFPARWRRHTVYLSLVRDQMMAILPVGHPLSNRAAATVADLAREPFIMSASGCEPLITDLARRAGVRLRSHYHVRDTSSILTMVAEQLGVSVMPELALPANRAGICAIPLKPAQHRTILLAVPADAPTVPAAIAFVELAVNVTPRRSAGIRGNEPAALAGIRPVVAD